jgi:hypothetical protein
MGRKPIGEAAMTPAERKRREREKAKPQSPLTTAAERKEALTVIRGRERVTITAIRAYRATLMADFEKKIAARYKPADHPVWRNLHEAACRFEAEADEKMRAVCRQHDVPEAWGPRINFSWYDRGESASAQRRAELRKIAVTEAERRTAVAEAELKRRSVDAQEAIIMQGITSEAARALIQSLPTVEQLMPPLDVEALERATTAKLRNRYPYLPELEAPVPDAMPTLDAAGRRVGTEHRREGPK